MHNFLALSSFIYIAIEIMWFFLWEDKRLQTKYKQDTGKHPYLYCCQPFSLKIKIFVNNILSDQVYLVNLPKLGDDIIEDVDEYKMTTMTMTTDRKQWIWRCNLRRVGCDIVEDVDEDKEQSDQKGHPARHDVGRDQERNPGNHLEQQNNDYKITCIDMI